MKKHGDLIDRDALIASLIPDPILCAGCPEPENMEEFVAWLESAEVVIPANNRP